MSDSSEEVRRKDSKAKGSKIIFYIIILMILAFGLMWLVGQVPAKEVSAKTTKTQWKFCWQEPQRGTLSCAPGAKNVQRIISVKEYNSSAFIFTVGWKENGVFKERARFTWDKIANPEHGTWHQLGSSYKEEGTWKLTMKRVGKSKIFTGYHTTNSDGNLYPTTLEMI